MAPISDQEPPVARPEQRGEILKLVLGGGVAGLIGTAYGWVLVLEAALFAALLGLAAINRFRLTRGLEGQEAQPARWALLHTIAAETGLGLIVVLAAGVLSGLEPGMHARHAEAGLSEKPKTTLGIMPSPEASTR